MIPSARELLSFAGRNGPLILFVGVLIGLVAPPLAEAARPLLGVAVFVFTLGGFLKVDFASFRSEVAQRVWITSVLAWTALGVPLVALGLITLLRPEPGLALGLTLCMLAPPVGSAAAIAAMMGLNAPLALLATMTATILSPAYLPPLVDWFVGYDLAIDPLAMTARLVAIVGGACLFAVLLKRFAGNFVAQNPQAMTGVAVIGLLLVAVGAMRGMQRYFLEQPLEVAGMLAFAFLVNAGFQFLGTALFWPSGRRRALTVGLVSGNRNVTLAWASAAPSLLAHPQVELYLAMSVFPIFMLPAVLRRPTAWLMRPRVPESLASGAPAL